MLLFVSLMMILLLTDFRFWVVKMATRPVDPSYSLTYRGDIWVRLSSLLIIFADNVKAFDIHITNHNSAVLLYTFALLCEFPTLTCFGATHNRYLAPEYFMHGVVDEKTDVFSYGVLLLELITGRRPVNNEKQNLVIWVSMNLILPLLPVYLGK